MPSHPAKSPPGSPAAGRYGQSGAGRYGQSGAGRYGQSGARSGRRRALALALLGLAFTAAVVAVALPRLSPGVTYAVRGFQTVDASTVRVTWEVARDPGTVVECQVRARDEAGAEVGNELIVVPADGERRTVVTRDLPTAATAVTGEVRSCIVVQP